MTEVGGAEIEVGMFESASAEAPDWLSTHGVDSCIAVAIADDSARRAWLIHTPEFDQSCALLEDALGEATASAPGGQALTIWVVGGSLKEKDSRSSVKAASDAVRRTIKQLAPQARFNEALDSEIASIQLRYTDGWRIASEQAHSFENLDLENAEAKVARDLAQFFAQVRGIIEQPRDSVETGIDALRRLRTTVYEDMNQIQHEYAAVRAARWLVQQLKVSEGVKWRWHPRQTGPADEPDLQATAGSSIVLSAEVTTSAAPVGVIDKRMSATLKKLSVMKGKLYYFVLTEAMARRARTKVRKARYSIDVVCL